MALQAILAGGSWDQLPANEVLALSHTMGNGALLDLCALRAAGEETDMRPLPGGECGTGPVNLAGGEMQIMEAPDFGTFSPMGAAAPMEL